MDDRLDRAIDKLTRVVHNLNELSGWTISYKRDTDELRISRWEGEGEVIYICIPTILGCKYSDIERLIRGDHNFPHEGTN
jgi:hypothetical protein